MKGVFLAHTRERLCCRDFGHLSLDFSVAEIDIPYRIYSEREGQIHHGGIVVRNLPHLLFPLAMTTQNEELITYVILIVWYY
jgi:hypothetical protein